jgi:adenylate kinase family enzyme
MKERIYTDEFTLIRAIRNLSLNSPSVISIDGVDGVGKSTLARKITEELSLPHIEIDAFVQAQKGGYINYIDYDRLSERIVQPMISNQMIVVEGICVQQVLNKISLNPDVSVYVKVINHYGLWMDQIRLFPPDRSADEMIDERMAKRFSLGHIEETIRYHYTFKPHENADFIFERRS